MKLTLSHTPPPVPERPSYTYYEPEVYRVLDGDTLQLRVAFAFDIESKPRLRLVGIRTAEVRGKSKPEGLRAKAALQDFLDRREGLIARSYPERTFERWMGEVWVKLGGVWRNLSLLMIEGGYATPSDGRSPQPVLPEETP